MNDSEDGIPPQLIASLSSNSSISSSSSVGSFRLSTLKGDMNGNDNPYCMDANAVESNRNSNEKETQTKEIGDGRDELKQVNDTGARSYTSHHDNSPLKKTNHDSFDEEERTLPINNAGTGTFGITFSEDHNADAEPEETTKRGPTPTTLLDKIVSCSGTDYIRNGLTWCVVKLSVSAARKPIWTIVGTIVVSFLMIFFGIRAEVELDVDFISLFAPFNGLNMKHYTWMKNIDIEDQPQYKNKLSQQRSRQLQQLLSDSDSTTLRETDFLGPDIQLFPQQQSIMMTPSSSPTTSSDQQHRNLQVERGTDQASLIVHIGGENILSPQYAIEGVRRLFDALDTLRNLPEWEIICDNCPIYSVTRFWDNNRTEFERQVREKQNFYQDVFLPTISRVQFSDGTAIDSQIIIGRVERDPETDLVTFGESYSVVTRVQNYNFQPGVGLQTEPGLLKNTLELRQQWKDDDDNIFRLECSNTKTFEQEIYRAVITDLPLIPSVFIIMIIFTCVIFYRHNDTVQSRTMIGVGSVITITLSIATGFGVAFLSGVVFTPVTLMLPFLIFGIGLDDTFIITGAYFETDPRKDTVDRIAETMETVGLSITTTTLTTTLAFLLGLISTVPAIHYLMLYAFPTVMIDFLYQITFFVAILALDERRIKRQRNDFCYYCCLCYLCCKSTRDTDVPYQDIEQEQQHKQIQAEQKRPSPQERPRQEQQQQELQQQLNAETASTTLVAKSPAVTTAKRGGRFDFMKWYSNLLMKPVIKRCVMFVFLAYFGAMTYLTTLQKQEFKITEIFPKDSYASGFLDNLQAYTRRGVMMQLWFRFVDPSSEDIRQQMRDYINDLTELPEFEEPPVFCWVLDMYDLLEEEEFSEIKEYLDNSDMTFNEQLDFILDANPLFRDVYGRSFRRDDDGNIVWTRCKMFLSNLDLDDARAQLNAFAEIKRVTAEQPINQPCGNPFTPNYDDYSFFLYEELIYTWEFFAAAVSELISTTISTVVAVCVVVFLVVPHWSAILIVFPIIAILYIDLIGTLQFIGIRINAVTYISMVISIGLMVDFVLHILLRYYESKCGNREDKVKDCLRTMGKSILIGGVSTFLGAVPLLFSTSGLLSTMFVTFFVIVTLSLLHGLIFLPVVLSILGPVN